MDPLEAELLAAIDDSGYTNRESFDAFGPALDPPAREKLLNGLISKGLILVAFGGWGDAPLQLVGLRITQPGREALAANPPA